MSVNAFSYLVGRFIYRVSDFLRHWYWHSMRIYSNRVLDLLEAVDYRLAWRITLKNLFEPLYKDYTAMGYVLGFSFRALRLCIGGLIYLFVFAVAIALYAVWIAIPAYLIFKTISSFWDPLS